MEIGRDCDSGGARKASARRSRNQAPVQRPHDPSSEGPSRCAWQTDLGCLGLPVHQVSTMRTRPWAGAHFPGVQSRQPHLLWWPNAHWASARGGVQTWMGAGPSWEKSDGHRWNTLGAVALVVSRLIPTTTLEGKCNPYSCFTTEEGVREGKITLPRSVCW